MIQEDAKKQSGLSNQPPDVDIDIAGRFLSEALRKSFVILNIIMLLLVAIFLASGFITIEPDEQALVLRFGKIRGTAEARTLGPGLHWVFPYPIDEVIRIPTEKIVNIPINSFWYYQTAADMLPKTEKDRTPPPPTLRPSIDGYCITRGERADSSSDPAGADYGIVHCKWQLTYKIDDPERFFKNVYVQDINPGQSYFDVVKKNIDPFLKSLFEDAVVSAMVHYTIDEAILSKERIPAHIQKLLQEKLDSIQSGIKVVSIQLTDNITWPRQVDDAFLASIKASQASQTIISQARGYAEKTLNETAGPVALELFDAIMNKDFNDQQKELLWGRLAGQAQETLSISNSYRAKVIGNAKSNAEYLEKILPEYRKRPDLVIQRIYKDAIENILENADEKMVIQAAEGTGKKELRIQLNRDPTLKSKSEEKQ